ncbi:hypothetical protein [uncultured Bacteroides sp.]|uniref:hypothetical protein n=1 Tax=uncultured Bacteroides sp. TaxID=162156 RepID=UPI002605BB2C|nr:hypothetical protein [uncultured Bacteroides sp.]
MGKRLEYYAFLTDFREPFFAFIVSFNSDGFFVRDADRVAFVDVTSAPSGFIRSTHLIRATPVTELTASRH